VRLPRLRWAGRPHSATSAPLPVRENGQIRVNDSRKGALVKFRVLADMLADTAMCISRRTGTTIPKKNREVPKPQGKTVWKGPSAAGPFSWDQNEAPCAWGLVCSCPGSAGADA
jgi:hypothetical protein